MINLFGDKVIEPDVIEEDDVKRAAVPKLYDWLTAINSTKTDLRKVGVPGNDKIFPDPEMRGYEPFIINKGLGQSQATIGFANLMNRMPHIPKEYQYLFLVGGIPKNRSFAKWAKVNNPDKLKEVMARLNYSEAKAKEAIRVLGKEGVKKLLFVKGGVTK